MATPAKSFVLGCLTGAVMGPVLLALGGLAVIFTFRDAFTDFAASQQAARLQPPALGMGLEADYSMALRATDGTVHSLGDFRDRTLLLYFWHPGCVACLAGLPALKELDRALADRDALILMIAVGGEDEIEVVRQSYGLDFPQYILDGARPAAFDSKNITPAAFLVGPDGAIVFRHAGAAQWDADALAALVRAVSAATNAADARP